MSKVYIGMLFTCFSILESSSYSIFCVSVACSRELKKITKKFRYDFINYSFL